MCLAVAIAYDWCFDAMGEADRRALERAMLDKALVQPDGRLVDGWFTHADNNWGQVCQAGLCAAAIALSDVEPLVSDRVIARAAGCLPRCMAAYAEGGFPEGPAAYWFYAMEFTAVVMAELEKACGTDFGLRATPGLDRQLDFIDGLTGPTGQTFNFADGGRYKVKFEGVKRTTSVAEWFLADAFGTPEKLSRNARGLLEEAVSQKGTDGYGRLFPLTLLWIPDEAKMDAPCAPLKSTRIGGRVPVGVLRRGDAFAALKGGMAADHHGHLDVGSFVYDAKGVRWAMDLGAETHNVFSLDGKNAKPSGYADVAVEGDCARADLTACYPGAKRAVRTLTLTDGGLQVSDVIEGLAPGTVVDWHFITDAEATSAGEGVLKLAAGGATRTVRAPGAKWSVVSVAEPPRPCETRNDGAFRAAFRTVAPESGRVELLVTFGE